MAFTYTAGSGTSRDKLRDLLGDNTEASYIWEDAELDTYLSVNDGNLFLAAASACRTLALTKAQSAVMYRLAETLRVDKRDIPKILLQMARDYTHQAESGSSAAEYFDVAQINIDPLTGDDNSEYVDTIVVT